MEDIVLKLQSIKNDINAVFIELTTELTVETQNKKKNTRAKCLYDVNLCNAINIDPTKKYTHKQILSSIEKFMKHNQLTFNEVNFNNLNTDEIEQLIPTFIH